MKKSTLITVLLISFILFLPSYGLTEQKQKRDTVLQLDYTPINLDLPMCPEKIAVVKFTLSRPIDSVGESTTFNFTPSVDIGTWMGKALYTQLKSEGFNVEYFETMDDAGDMFIITGIANKVYINRPGQLEMKYKVRLDGMVTKDNKLLYSQNYISKQEKNMANTGDNAGKLMAGLHDIFSIFIPQAIKTINDHK